VAIEGVKEHRLISIKSILVCVVTHLGTLLSTQPDRSAVGLLNADVVVSNVQKFVMGFSCIVF